MAKGKKKQDDGEEGTLRKQLENMTPYRLSKAAKEMGLSQETLNKAPTHEDIIDLCVAKEMGKPLPKWAASEDGEDEDHKPSKKPVKRQKDDEDDEDEVVQVRHKPLKDEDDDDGDGDDGGDEDDEDGDGDGDGDDEKDEDGDNEDEDEDEVKKEKKPRKTPTKTPIKNPVKDEEEDLLQHLLDLVAVQGRVIQNLMLKVELVLKMSELALRNSYKAFTSVDKAFGKLFKQQGVKGMDKVRAIVEENDVKLISNLQSWKKTVSNSNEVENEQEED